MALYKDSVGNTYDRLPPKPPNKSAKGSKPGPKHGKKHVGPTNKHGTETGRNGPRSRERYFGEPAQRAAILQARNVLKQFREKRRESAIR